MVNLFMGAGSMRLVETLGECLADIKVKSLAINSQLAIYQCLLQVSLPEEQNTPKPNALLTQRDKVFC